MRIFLIILAVVAVLFLLRILLRNVPVLTWILVKLSGLKITFRQLLFCSVEKIPIQHIVDAMIDAHKAGLKDEITFDQLFIHQVEGGDVKNAVNIMVTAKEAELGIPFELAMFFDNEGIDANQAILKILKKVKKPKKNRKNRKNSVMKL